MSVRFTAEVTVMPKAEVADPQGLAVREAAGRHLRERGSASTIAGIRIGKRIVLECDGESAAEVEKTVRHLAETILTNPNIEEFSVKLSPSGGGSR